MPKTKSPAETREQRIQREVNAIMLAHQSGAAVLSDVQLTRILAAMKATKSLHSRPLFSTKTNKNSVAKCTLPVAKSYVHSDATITSLPSETRAQLNVLRDACIKQYAETSGVYKMHAKKLMTVLYVMQTINAAAARKRTVKTPSAPALAVETPPAE